MLLNKPVYQIETSIIRSLKLVSGGGRGLNHLMLVLFIGKNSKKLDPKSHLINQSYRQDNTMK